MLEWLTSRMKEADTSRLAFDSHAALLGTDSHRISRGEINARLDGWWTDHCTRVGALLGQEGVGKTWAALDWVLGRIDSDPGFPLAVEAFGRRDSIHGPELGIAVLERLVADGDELLTHVDFR